MKVLEALSILEAAILECKKRDIDTPEDVEALDLLDPLISPRWMVPQFRRSLGRLSLVSAELRQPWDFKER